MKRPGWVWGLLGVLHVPLLLAGFVAPYGATSQLRTAAWAPPSRIHLRSPGGEPYLLPRVSTPGVDGDRRQRLALLVEGEPYRFLGLIPSRTHLFGVQGSGRIHLLGTDGLGRDLFSRLLLGARLSLLAGLLATLVTLAAGALVGLTAGWLGGLADEVLMRLSELFLALPWLYLLFAVRAFLPLDAPPATTFVLLVLTIGLLGWAQPARLVRGMTLSLRRRTFVLAARGAGLSTPRLLWRHLLPQVAGLLATQGAVLLPRFIVAEVTLSFLGLGLGDPLASWGTLLAPLERFVALPVHWWVLTPAVALVCLLLVYQLAGQRLRRRLSLAGSV